MQPPSRGYRPDPLLLLAAAGFAACAIASLAIYTTATIRPHQAGAQPADAPAAHPATSLSPESASARRRTNASQQPRLNATIADAADATDSPRMNSTNATPETETSALSAAQPPRPSDPQVTNQAVTPSSGPEADPATGDLGLWSSEAPQFPRSARLQPPNRPTPPVATGINEPNGQVKPAISDTVDLNTPRFAAWDLGDDPRDSVLVTGRNLMPAGIAVQTDDNLRTHMRLRGGDHVVETYDPRGSEASEGVASLLATANGETVDAVVARAPEAWWARAESINGNARLRIFGRRLTLGEFPTRVRVTRPNGETETLTPATADIYHLTVDVDRLTAGVWSLSVHNGTGTDSGWSEPLTLEVAPGPDRPHRTLTLSREDIDRDGFPTALRTAIREAARVGGAVIDLPSGHYELDRGLTVSADTPIILRGAGPTETVLTTPPGFPDTALVRLDAPGGGLESLGLTHDFAQTGVQLNAPHQTLRGVRIERSAGSGEGTSVVCRNDNQAVNQIIEDCDFLTTLTAVRVAQGTHGVRISKCRMVGRFSTGSGTEANAVVSFGNQTVIEECDVRSEDRRHGKLFCRLALFYESDSSQNYVARNRATDVGPHPSVPGIDANTGEVILFHSRGGRDQGEIGHVEAMGPETLTVDWTVEMDRGQIAFLASGPGLGQYREITQVRGKALTLNSPWRVPPQRGDAVVIYAAARQNLVIDNSIDSSPDANDDDLQMKRVGVLAFHGFVGNVVARNHIKNATAGIFIIGSVTRPAMWNQILNNRIEHMGGETVGHVRAEGIGLIIHEWADLDVPLNQAIGIGTRISGNLIIDAPAGIRTGWSHSGNRWAAQRFRAGPAAGVIGDIVERNQMRDVEHAVIHGRPNNSTVIRNNDLGEFGRIMYSDPAYNLPPPPSPPAGD